MIRQDRVKKWFLYALGVLPVWILETMILSRYPLRGVIPVLLPLAGVAASLWEGPIPGGVFGLFLGVFCDAVYPGAPGGMTLGVTLLCVATGLMCQYRVKQNFLGFLLCSAGSLLLIDLVRVIWGAVVSLGPVKLLVLTACKEIGWSLVFTVPIYLLYKLLHALSTPRS